MSGTPSSEDAPRPAYRRVIVAVLLAAMSLWYLTRLDPSHNKDTLRWDGFGYWAYLPLVVVHDDLGMRIPGLIEGIMSEYAPSATFYQAHQAPNGNRVIRYTPGLALLHAPGFLLAHAFAEPLGHKPDGFSIPYQRAAVITYLLFVLGGLLLTWKLVRMLFAASTSRWAMLLVLLGTNLFLYFETNPMMTHGYSFFFVAATTLLTVHWHRHPRLRTAIALGCCLGFITLIRPPDVLVAIIPLLWPMQHRSWPNKLRHVFRHHITHVGFALVAFCIAVAPLFIYWKVIAGSWFWDSYQNPGEGIDLHRPHLIDFLFSFRKGWLLFSPMIGVALLGLVPLWKHERRMAFAIGAFLLVDLYVVSSWTVWWYPGAFGQRAMIQTYPVIALLLAAGIDALPSFRSFVRHMWIGLATALVALNLVQNAQFRVGIWHIARETKAHYLAVLFDHRIDVEKDKLLLVDRITADRHTFKDRALYQVYPIDGTTMDIGSEQDAPNGRKAFLLDAATPYTPALERSFTQLTPSDHAWVQICAEVWCDTTFSAVDASLVATFDHGGNYAYTSTDLTTWEDLVPGRWNTVCFHYLTPEVRDPEDELRVYGWHRRGVPVWIDELRIESWIRR